ncbi:uncharacterized protein EI97DRAFT_367437 [Westerdykella ornata]|uniref:Uncharacterized protein n=1 Tax=Westerdykella ornata TaxID=318751 RepID=A0A6A6JZN8_WESOR|nr:uncharacterized protein EI97DRAFT_367437 [Westerdykella ornata]KAF2281246.1 hypothetical protein EI97DRAFT_367437 [Westerdykella ornata]
MVATGISPSTSQKAAYLESMFLNGMEQQALKEWEELFAQSTSESEMHFQRGLAETGARMHALAGNLDRAKMIAEKIFDHLPSWDPEVIMVVFRAHTRSKAALHHEQAWDLYLRMKTLLGENFQAIAYNNCFIGFLEARNLQYARQVLGDMVKAGVLANGDSEEHVLEVRRKLHLLNRLTTDIVQATSVALYALTTLPRAYHVHVFADWIKLAAAKKAPEAAAQILDMMFRRGHQPDTVNFNYFLRSLFSTKQKSHELRAENIAWHMVDMASRAASGNGRRQPRTSVSDPLLLRKIPPANGATYALLIRHHANHSQWEHTDYLIRHMRARQIPQNTETMNVSMDSLCRQGDYNKVWDTYSTLTNPPKEQPGVFPNGATFRCLWKTLRLALGDVEHREHSTLPGPRELLAENIRWWNMVRSRYDASRFRAGLAAEDSGALSKLVMHCFSYKKDLPGSLVAMHALRSQFYILPSMEASWILQNQIAWVEASREAKTARARYRMSGLHQRNLKQVGRVQNILFHDRLARMNMSEEEFASLNDERKADITLDSLSEFIRAVLKRQHAPEDVEAMIDKAKNDIGMPNLPTGDMDAFIVA